jgi:WD40 repeat protein
MTSSTIKEPASRFEEDGQAQPPDSFQKKRRARKFLARFFFGDDVFISYSRRDAANYALKLANELTKHNLSCYVDQWGTPPGSKLPEKLKTALRRSTMLILIGSEGATDSPAVKQEVEEFLKTGRTIIPISFEGSLEAAEWFPSIKGLAIAQESRLAQQTGQPEQEVINRIVNAKGFTRRNARLRKVFFATVLSVILVVLSGGYIGGKIVQKAQARVKEAEGKVVEANAKVQAAEGKVIEANAKVTDAEGKVLIANNKVIEAEGKLTTAERKASEAEDKASAAKTREDAARVQEQIARDNAEKQQKIALSRQLAGRSVASIGSRHDAALLLGIEAEKVTDTVEARRALLEALHHYPNLKHMFRGYSTQIYQVAFAPDGKSIAASTYDGSVSIWDIENGNMVKLPPGTNRRFACFAFSPDSRKLAVCGDNGRIRLWDLAAQKMVYETQQIANELYMNSLAFTEDKRIISEGAPGSMLFWDASNDQVKLTDTIPVDPNEYILTLALSPDQKILAAVSKGKRLFLFDAKTHEQLGKPIEGFKDYVVKLSFSHDGRLLASVEQQGGIILWDVANRKQLTIEGDLLGGATNAAFSPLGDSLITTKGDGTITRWSYTVIQNSDDQSGSVRIEKQHSADLTLYKAKPYSLAVNPSGKLLASGNADGTVTVWDLDGSSQLYQKADEGGGAIYIAYSSDNKRMVTVDKDQNVLLWDEGKHSRIILSNEVIGGHISSIALSPSGHILAVARKLKPALVVDIESNIILGEIGHKIPEAEPGDEYRGYQKVIVPEPFVQHLAISHDEKLLVSATGNGDVSFWQIPSLMQIGKPFTRHGTFLEFSPNGRFLAATLHTGPISLWDLANKGPASEPQKISQGDMSIQEMTFGADSKTILLFAKTDVLTGQLITIDLKSPRPKSTVIGTFNFQEDANTPKVAFSPDGKTLAYLAPRSSLNLWDIPTRSPLGQLNPGVSTLGIFTFTPDSKKLVIRGDGELLIWNLDVKYWISLACNITKGDLRVSEWQQQAGGGSATVCSKNE